MCEVVTAAAHVRLRKGDMVQSMRKVCDAKDNTLEFVMKLILGHKTTNPVNGKREL